MDYFAPEDSFDQVSGFSTSVFNAHIIEIVWVFSDSESKTETPGSGETTVDLIATRIEGYCAKLIYFSVPS